MEAMPQALEQYAERALEIASRIFQSAEMIDVFHLALDGEVVDLLAPYRLCQRQPEKGVELTTRYFELTKQSRQHSLEAVPTSWLLGQVLPSVRGNRFFMHRSREEFAHMSWVNETVVLFRVRAGDVAMLVRTEHLVKHKLSVETLFEASRVNLESQSEGADTVRIEPERGGMIYSFARRDGLNAARLLLSDLHKRWSPQFGGNFWAMIPGSNTLIAYSDEPDEVLKRVRLDGQSAYRTEPIPVSLKPFRVTRDGIAGSEN